MGVVLDGYCSDMTRVLHPQQPSKRQKEIYELLVDTTQTIIDEIKIGTPLREYHIRAQKLLGTYSQYFTHGLGHGIGIDIHEQPNLSPKSEEITQPGMVFTIEPGIYIPDEIGSRFEQIVVVHPDGNIKNIIQAPSCIHWN